MGLTHYSRGFVLPTISFANPKGGVGKSTTALVLATTLANEGASVVVLDCDPNQAIVGWRKGSSTNSMVVDGEVTESNVIGKIQDYRSRYQFVFVDLQGTPNRLMSRAIARSDLVVIPLQASPADAEQAIRAIQLIQEEEETLERKIPFKIVVTRTSAAIQTRIEKIIVDQLQNGVIPTFNTHMKERSAFKAMFLYHKDLTELDPSEVNGLDKARENGAEIASELVSFFAQKVES